MQAVRESGAKETESKRNLKRNEKSSWQMENDVVRYKSCVMKSESLERNSQLKNFEKTWKKFLTKFESCDKINEFAANWNKFESERLYLVNWIT